MTAPATPEAVSQEPVAVAPAPTPNDAPQQIPPQQQTDVDPAETEPTQEAGNVDELPAWAQAKLSKANREAHNLRTRLKEQEPLVAAAQEAKRANMDDLQRANADLESTRAQLAQRDTELLQARYQLTDEDLEFIGDGTFAEKEARAQRFAARVNPQPQQPEQPSAPPARRPVESLRPGASPTPPPVADTTYPASWGFQPPTQS